MSYFDRQEMIPGWDQVMIRSARVLVHGRGPVGAAATWALISLGVGEIIWLGAPRRGARRLSRFLARRLAPSLGTILQEYPFEPRRTEELKFALGSERLTAIFHAEPGAAPQLARAADRLGVLRVSARDGFPRAAIEGEASPGEEFPPSALLAAALAVDEFRHRVSPVQAYADREIGDSSFRPPRGRFRRPVVVVGAGAVGTYAAFLLAAARQAIVIVDFDSIEPSNLNRQGLFTAAEAAVARPKAEALTRALKRLHPAARIDFLVHRVTPVSRAALASWMPAAIVSAVDNAESRLALSDLAADLGAPLVQAGTDAFSADCYTQVPGGPSLDAEMHGALSAAAESELERSREGCAAQPGFVVPGMVAGAFAAARVFELAERGGRPESLHWRSGMLPRTRRGADE